MITTLTETSATGKLCPLSQSPNQSSCCGSDCMAWQWAEYASLQETRYIQVGHNVPEGLSEKPSDAEIRKRRPAGEGWRIADEDSIHFYDGRDDGEESYWEINWERDSDPERQGYCAALPHPLAIHNKLDGLIGNLVDLLGGK